MGQAFASGKHAFGFCDRCGFRYALHKLQTEVVNLTPTNIRVCPSCFDPDQPQNQLGRYEFNDPQALRNPRPPLGLNASRYGDSIRFDFDTQSSANLWNVAAGAEDLWVLAWQSESETVTLTASPAANPSLIRLGSTADPIDINPSVYRYVRCRMKVNDFGASRYNWIGTFSWGHYADTLPVYSVELSGGRPDFEAMGDPWVLLTWDMLGVGDWINGSSPDLTVKSLRFNILELVDTVVEIDYISVDKGPSQS